MGANARIVQVNKVYNENREYLRVLSSLLTVYHCVGAVAKNAQLNKLCNENRRVGIFSFTRFTRLKHRLANIPYSHADKRRSKHVTAKP